MMLSGSNGVLESVGSAAFTVDAEANMLVQISTEFSHSGPSRRLELTRHEMDTGKNSSCVLVTMPQDANLRSIDTTLIPLDRDGTKRVRIVLTPTIQSTYESDTATMSQHLPAVIDRDTRTLIPGPTPRHDARTPRLANFGALD
jgi:hypothetical protein